MTTERERVLEEALRNLIAKLGEIEPHVNSAFFFASVHGYKYSGPNYRAELDAANAALASPLRPEGEAVWPKYAVRSEGAGTSAGLSGLNAWGEIWSVIEYQDAAHETASDGLWVGFFISETAADTVAAALSARPQPPQQPVAVKTLEWSDSAAQSVAGVYRLVDDTNFLSDARYSVWLDSSGDDEAEGQFVVGGFGNWGDAAAAAQADYETRIRSALYAAPLAQPVVTAGEERESTKARILSRDVLRSECSWLDRDYAAGEKVYLFTGYTHGCIGPNGVAVSQEADATPFFELPAAALRPPVTQPEEAGK